MTVGKLIKLLSAFDPDTPVRLARDAEGNSFPNLASVGFDATGDVEDPDADLDDEQPGPAVLLWPE